MMERVWHKPIIEDLGAPTEYHRKLILHDLPAPLVPPEINLRDYPSMMVDVERWRDSDFVLTAPAEIYRYASLLWLAAWHQIPAGSLPNDESLLKVLAKHSGNFRGFRRMLPEILHGFIECSDGRLYHPVVAEKALAAWESKQKQRARTEAARNAPLKATQGSRPVTDHEHNNKDLQSSRPVTASKRSKVKGREEKEESKPTESSFSFADDPPKEVAANAAPKKRKGGFAGNAGKSNGGSHHNGGSKISRTKPVEADRVFARQHGLDPDFQWDKFRAHHKSKGTKSEDWSAEFEKWILIAVERREDTNQPDEDRII